MKTYTLSEIKTIVSRLAKQYGAERIYLFGSYARGDMTNSSDIDLRIDKGNIRGFQSVSYTHLDVYKRQAIQAPPEMYVFSARNVGIVLPRLLTQHGAFRSAELVFPCCLTPSSADITSPRRRIFAVPREKL